MRSSKFHVESNIVIEREDNHEWKVDTHNFSNQLHFEIMSFFATSFRLNSFQISTNRLTVRCR